MIEFNQNTLYTQGLREQLTFSLGDQEHDTEQTS
jgi:hypothetical protein